MAEPLVPGRHSTFVGQLYYLDAKTTPKPSLIVSADMTFLDLGTDLLSGQVVILLKVEPEATFFVTCFATYCGVVGAV